MSRTVRDKIDTQYVLNKFTDNIFINNVR